MWLRGHYTDIFSEGAAGVQLSGRVAETGESTAVAAHRVGGVTARSRAVLRGVERLVRQAHLAPRQIQASSKTLAHRVCGQWGEAIRKGAALGGGGRGETLPLAPRAPGSLGQV